MNEKEDFIAAWRDECVKAVSEITSISVVTIEDFYDVIAPKLMEGLEQKAVVDGKVIELDPRHVVVFREDGWNLRHPVTCREVDLLDCPVNVAVHKDTREGPPIPLGKYVVTLSADDPASPVQYRELEPQAGASYGEVPSRTAERFNPGRLTLPDKERG